MSRRSTRLIHALDHTIGRLSGLRRVLVELRTPVYRAVLGPVCDRLEKFHDVSLTFTSEYPDLIRPLVGAARFITHQQAEWRRFDLYMNADPWAAARLRRCARRINFFHGVAGKYDLDCPQGLPIGLEYYDRIAFINRDRMGRYLDAGLVSPAQARLVGYPKLDRLAAGAIDGAAVRHELGFQHGRPTVLYAPTYSPASSLHIAGEAIVRSLADAGLNVLIKLHDRSFDQDSRYTDGIDWRARMRALERDGGVRHVEGADAAPLMAAADVMVTDHSSVGFEFLVLDRPLVIFDAPDLQSAARINPEKVALLRSAARVVTAVGELGATVHEELATRERLTVKRRMVADAMFHDPGYANDRAVALVRELLDTPALAVPVTHAQPAPGGAS